MVIYSNGCSHTKTSDHFFSHGYIDIISKELFGESYKQIELPRGLNNYYYCVFVHNYNFPFITHQREQNNIIFGLPYLHLFIDYYYRICPLK